MGLFRSHRKSNDEPEALSAGREAGGEETSPRAPSGLHAIGLLLSAALNLPPLVILSSFTINLLGLALPLVVLQIFDRVLRFQASNTLLLLIGGLACVVIAETVLRFARNRLIADRALQESFQLQMKGALRYLHAPPANTAKLPSNEAVDGMSAMDDMSQFLSGSGRLALLDMPFVGLFLLLIWLIAGPVVLVPIVIIVGFTVWTIWSSANFKHLLKAQTKQERERFDFYSECLKGIATVKSLAIEPQMQRRLEGILQSGAQTNYHMVLHANRMAAAGQFFASLTIISLVTVGGVMAIEDLISIGAVAACLLIGNRVTQPVLRTVGVWGQLEAARAAQDRYAPLLALPEDRTEPPDHQGPASLELAGFAMAPGSREAAPAGVDLVIPAGNVAGVVIPDFAQRADFVRVLRGQAFADHGKVLIDGADIATSDGAGLLHGVFFVGSQPDVFHGTILDNMSMFRRVSHTAALETARRLGLDPGIQALPQGYDTRLGDIGAAALPLDILQAICVARAVLMRPRFLMIDIRRIPPDDVSTRACTRAIEELRGLTTILTIGKQMSEVRDAERVFSMHDWCLQPVAAEPREAAGSRNQSLENEMRTPLKLNAGE